MGYWKGKVIKFLKLKNNGITFQPALYDYIYCNNKKSIGIITEFHSQNILSVSFFKSLNNNDSFFDVINMDNEKDLIIPSFESLLKIGHLYIKKTSQTYQTDEFIVDKDGDLAKEFNKFRLYGRMNILFKQSGDLDDYDNLLNLVVKLIQENHSRLAGRE
jgi:hypothetical protein